MRHVQKSIRGWPRACAVLAGLILVAADGATGAEKAATADSSVAVSGKDTKTNEYEEETMNPNTTTPSQTITLDGPDWKIATDPDNKGRDEKWFDAPRAEAKTTPVPWVIQNIFTGYHGVAWYWRTFKAPANPHLNGRYLLQFGAVDYLAQVWVNGKAVGGHEGGDTPFTLDVTDAIIPGQENLLAVRVLNPPENRGIDCFVLKETCSGAKHDNIAANMVYNSGGIVGAVELLMVPQLRITDLHVMPDWKTGKIRIRAALLNAAGSFDASAKFSVVSAVGGAPLAMTNCSVRVEAGTKIVEASLRVPNHRLWSPDEPALYRVTANVQVARSPSMDERSVRCGFRDFRFENGYFQLNGRRIFLNGAIYLPHFPITYTFPHDPELVRRDVSNLKKAGYNLVRISFRSAPWVLELCDEAGVLAYQEHYGSWQLQNSPAMKSRWNASISEVILRDRNHPSLVMLGLLNETGNDPVFNHAVTCLPMIRELDPTRLVQLNSGRFDGRADVGSLSNPGSVVWDGKMSDLLDIHAYPFCPLSQEVINMLRTIGKGGFSMRVGQVPGLGDTSKGGPVFVSEYGQCGTMNLPSELAQFKRLGQEQSDDARYYRKMMDGFMADWTRWRLDEIWKRPEDYFSEGLRHYARLKEPGETALRSNPALIAYSSTHGIFDSAFCGHALTTLFREPKDPSLFEGARLANAPLRWCLFATPNNIYRGSRVRFEAVLADVDMLPAGEYPARVEILGPDRRPIATREIRIRLGNATNYHERAFATPCFSEEIVVDGPAGAYELLVTMSDGRKIPGDRLTFYVDDPGTMPALPPEVTLWGEDAALSGWLTGHGAKTIPFDPLATKRQIIVVGAKPLAPGGAEAFAQLVRQIARGSAVVFLDRGLFADGNNAVRRQPLVRKVFKGADWVGSYFRAERWTKHHAIFKGLPSGGMMDYAFYGSLISNDVLPSEEDLAKPAPSGPRLSEVVCGATRTSSDRGLDSWIGGGAGIALFSGLHVAIYELGAGRFILNTLNILPNLDKHPAAERLLRNMLNYAARDIDKPRADLSVVASAVSSERVVLTFSEPVQQADAETIANYTIIPGVQVLAASLGDMDCGTVTLTTSPLSVGEYTLTVKNIRDCARKPNMIAANTSKAFRYSPLVARWKLDEGKGLVVADAGGHKLDGVLKGGATWTNVAGRQAVMLDGATGIVETSTKLEHLALPFTFTFWMNPAAEQMDYADIFGNHGGSVRGLVMQQEGRQVNLFGFAYGDGKQWQGHGTVQLTAGQWQHVAVVCDGSKAFFYVNGEVKSSGAAAGVLAPNPDMMFRLGQGFEQDGRFFRGLLSDVRIYRKALSPAEVQSVMKE